MKYKKHIFICTNQKPEGKKSCGEVHGMQLVDAFKQLVKDHDLSVDVRAQKAGCLDVCGLGPAMVVYPEGIFYGKVQLEDVQEIFDKHIIHNEPVERLRLKF